MEFDALDDLSEEEYHAFWAWLTTRTVAELEHARLNNGDVRTIITSYLQTCYQSHRSISEALDYFAVSTPNIVERAGYGEEAFQEVMRIYDEVNPVLARQYFRM